MSTLKSYAKNIERLINKSKLQRIIYRVEVSAPKMGIPSYELLMKYSVELKKDKQLSSELAMISRRLKDKNEPKDIAYKPYLDQDIIALIKEANKKQIALGTIFQDYAPIKEKATSTKRGVKAKLYFPFAIYFLLVFGLNEIVKEFVKIGNGDTLIKFTDFELFILNNYVPINLSYGIVLGFFLAVIPQKVPYLKGVFQRLNGILALSTARTMYKMSYTSGEIIQTLAKQFSLKETKKYKNDANGLLTLMQKEKMVTLEQAAELKINLERGEIEKGIDLAIIEKTEEIETLQETINSALKTISIVLLTPPIYMVIQVLIKLMNLGPTA
ncbi:MAG: hypothetical protein IE916_00295 [Epsilonproteobacteria bacterium]|nr:hypothetical protein [Campylobacterota bacterium]